MMFTKITIRKFYKKHLEMILDEIVDPMYAYLKTNTDVFESFQNRLLAFDLKYKGMYLVYNIFTTDCEILKDLIDDFEQQLQKIGVEYRYYQGCMDIFFEQLETFLHTHFTLSAQEKKLWDKKLAEIYEEVQKSYEEKAVQSDDFFDESYDHDIENLDIHHYEEEHKIDAQTFMSQNSIDPDEINEIRDLIEALEENIDINYQEGLNRELIENFKELILKMIGFYELSGEFRTLTHPMNNLYTLLESLDLSSLDDMMKDVIFNFLNNTVKDMKKWVDEVLIEQSTNDIHYLDASILASISQMEMMIAGSDDDEEEDDDDFLF